MCRRNLCITLVGGVAARISVNSSCSSAWSQFRCRIWWKALQTVPVVAASKEKDRGAWQD